VLLGGRVKAFVLNWWQVAEARIEPLLIVHVVDEATNLVFGVAKRLVLLGMLKRVNESLKSRCKALLCLVATVHIDFHRKTVLADSIPPCQPG
jgi:hypothetical protein